VSGYRAGVLTAVLLIGVAGCRHRTAAAATSGASTASTASTTSPATQTTVASSRPSGTRFQDAAHGFATTCPDAWTRRDANGPEDVLSLAGPGGAELSIAVPKLPAHVPGIIPLPAVQDGYVDDVRKRLADVTVTESAATRVTGASARRFAITGRDQGGPRKLLVIAIVKGDHLYIVTGEGPADRYDAVKQGVERVAQSWTWLKQAKREPKRE
jgi:hypothetical protein